MGTLSIVRPCSIGALNGGRATVDGGGTITAAGWLGPSGSTDTNLCVGIATPNGTTLYAGPTFFAGGNGIIEFEFDQNTPIFILDGASPISYNSLPSGFVITNLLFNMFVFRLAVLPVLSLTFRINDGTSLIPSPDGGVISDHDMLNGAPQMTAFAFIGRRLKAEVVYGDSTGYDPGEFLDIISMYNFSMEGTYSIESFSYDWTVDNQDVPVSVGSEIHIVSVDGTIGPTDITSITLVWTGGSLVIPSQYINIYTSNLVSFNIPMEMPIIDIEIAVVITSTLFIGTVTLGILEYLFVDASGIYVLTKDKKNDTFYDRDGDTVDIKIPNPFIKTGFIGG